MDGERNEFIATCAGGLEALLGEELEDLGCPSVRPLTGQAAFSGTEQDGERACASKLASRIILVLGRFPARDAEELYQGMAGICWEERIPAGVSFAIDAHGTNAELRNARFTAEKAKDAIVDRIRKARGARPLVNTDRPDVLVSVRISGGKALAGIVVSGPQPLFFRPYHRLEQRNSQLRADYAAAMIALAGGARSFCVPWDEGGVIRCELEAAGLALCDASEADAVLADLSWLHGDEPAREASARARLGRLAEEAPEGVPAVVYSRSPLFAEGAADRSLSVRIGRDEATMAAGPVRALSYPARIELGGKDVPVLVAASDQFAARLAKQAKLRAKQAGREEASCYRIYDADLPDYAVSVELFESTEGRRHLSVSEYAAPKGIDAALARARLLDALAISEEVLGISEKAVSVRVRSRERGGSQYAGLGSAAKRARPFVIDEGGLEFELDFSRRLDCGIFLDHRDTRAMLREMMKEAAAPKRFLNLFCYTATASCYAADGGAASTVSVDLSAPSLEWGRRNMERNGFSGPAHSFVQADVVSWVREARRRRDRFELIFCDVPTFSNSSRMGRRSFDVQRDHAELLIGVSRLLSEGGVCVFSCNLRSFKPDEEALAKAGVSIEDITASTIPFDFERSPRIHSCYLVRRS